MDEREDLRSAELRKISRYLETIASSGLILHPVWTIVKAWLAISLIVLCIAGAIRSCAG